MSPHERDHRRCDRVRQHRSAPHGARLGAFVDVNPISHLVTAVRGLLAGEGSAGDIALVLGEAAALTAVFAPLTARLYGKG